MASDSAVSGSLPHNHKWPMGARNQQLADSGAKAGWYRFMQVNIHVLTGHKLFRASAPGYNGSDSSQTMTGARADFLKSNGIDSILSFNEGEYKPEQRAILTSKGIAYLHIKVKDFGAATLEDMAKAWTFFSSKKATLVHCGFGWGRTGTGICALQLYSTKGAGPEKHLWGEVDGGDQVEKPAQEVMLEKLRDGLKSGSIPV